METDLHYVEHIEKLKKIGIALSAEKDIDEFFKLVLDEAISYTNADAGSLYRLSTDGKYLDFILVCTRSKNIILGRADTIKWPSVPLYDDRGNKILKNFVSYVVHNRKTVCIKDVYNQDVFDNSGTKKYDAANVYRSKSMVGVPLLNHENDILGVIQLINALDNKGEIVYFNNQHITMLESLASQAAIALTNKELIKGLENLLNQFVKSIANAIDRKSKYTGGHISRVAYLTNKLAHEIDRDSRIFPEVKFSDDEIQEISIAGWMHDVGKITTPEHIMDKATKLEKITDRVDLIELRIKLLKKVIELDKLCTDDSQESQHKAYQDKIDQLSEYFAFIKKINRGNEYLSIEQQQKIDEIASFYYHSNGNEYFLLTEEEKRNLAIKKGTLLPEEREKMKEHAIITHEMLSQLTFPKKFKNVPLYASSHHEKLNGKGYPLHLTAAELPLQARIVAIADIFESLTAADRPYKEGKSLDETLELLATWAKVGELDNRILDILIDSGLYLNYGKKFLQPKQLSKIDLEKIKSIYHV